MDSKPLSKLFSCETYYTESLVTSLVSILDITLITYLITILVSIQDITVITTMINVLVSILDATYLWLQS